MATLNSTIKNFVVGDHLNIERVPITLVPAGDFIVKAWLTVKRHENDLDPGVFQVLGAILDSGAATHSASVLFILTPALTLLLTGAVDYYFDVQVLTSLGIINTPEKGVMTATKQITRASA